MNSKLRTLVASLAAVLGTTFLAPVSPAVALVDCSYQDTDCETVISDGRWHYAVFSMTDKPAFHGNEDICGTTPKDVKIGLTVRYRTNSQGVEVGYLYLTSKTIELSTWRWGGEPGDGTFLSFYGKSSLKKYQGAYLADIGGKIAGQANWYGGEALFEIYLRPTGQSANCALGYFASLRK